MAATRRDHTVFILGAGFSAAGGVPTLATFLQSVREFHDDPDSKVSAALRARYERVLAARHRMGRCRDSLRLDLDNVETLFGLIDMEELVTPLSRDDRASSDDIKHVLAHTVHRTYTRTARMARVRLDASRVHEVWGADWISALHKAQGGGGTPSVADALFVDMPFYDYVVGMMTGLFESKTRASFTSAILTFNYDTVIEQSLLALGYGVDYGVTRAPYKGTARTGAVANRVRVLKLHGSANWAYVQMKNTRAHVYDDYTQLPKDATPILVPPTWRKGDVTELMKETWAAAAEELARATRVVIIGYSAPETDAHFKHLMANALAANAGLYSLAVIDWAPTTDAAPSITQQRYYDLFGPLLDYGRLNVEVIGLQGFVTRSAGGRPPCWTLARLGQQITFAGLIATGDSKWVLS